ncbi:MAG: cyanobactin biosynthesis system PatB/AcyB/McaB family protein [Symploca sp. SIO2E9]|nr:cyanobactin biosynthesis system PatB/AcyB/McaB family protein [Symploca sp. SIO2E9]
MNLPKQAAPVKRPDLISPHLAVDVIHGSARERLKIFIELRHGANYNDPPYYNYPSYDQIKTSVWGYYH